MAAAGGASTAAAIGVSHSAPRHPPGRARPGAGARPPTGSARAPAVSSAIIRSTLSMIPLGRGMTPRRLNPTPNGLESSSQSAAWVSHRGPPVQRSILRVRKAGGRANHASTSPTAIETARPRVRADRSHDRDRRRGEGGRSEPRAGEQHQPRIDAPEEHHQDDEWECGGQAVRSPEKARRHRAHHNLGAGELGRQQRVQALPVALRSDRSGDLSDDKPDRDACLREGGQANATRENRAASRTEVLSQPHSSQTTTQLATPHATSNSAMSRSRITLAIAPT